MLLLLLALATASAQDPLLTPDVKTLLASLTRIEAHLDTAEGLGVLTGRAQNTWLESVNRQTWPIRCNEAGAEQAAEARARGTAWREYAQSARAEARRIEEALSSPTVKPIIGAEIQGRAQQALERSEAQTQAYLASVAWQQRYLEPWAGRCPLPPAPCGDECAKTEP